VLHKARISFTAPAVAVFLLQDVLMIFQRCLDVLFYDIQMVASVVHSNRMLEGMTQVRTQLCFSCCYPGLQYTLTSQALVWAEL
jgi:hypothetical protein